MLFHCQPSGIVVGRPVVARFRVSFATGTEMAALFERDSSGNARIELRDPSSQAIHFAWLRPSEGNSDFLVFYSERVIGVRSWPPPRTSDALGGGSALPPASLVRPWPPSAAPDAWLFGFFQPQRTDEHQELAGYDARKVLLRGHGQGAGSIRDAGECWISESLMMVLRERVINDDGSVEEWNITELEEKQPTGDLLATPPDFKVIDPQRKQ